MEVQAYRNSPATGVASDRLGAGSWIIIVVLLSLLAGAGAIVYVGWTLGDGIEVTTAGYVAMALGIVFSLVVGCGLMALVFYSSRGGYDESPTIVEPEGQLQNDSGAVSEAVRPAPRKAP